MTYKTLYTSWSKEQGEHTKPTTTADTLPGYTTCNIWFNVKLKLFAIGGTPNNKYCGNWDIYADSNGTLYSIARPGTSCKNSYFGDTNHIKHLMKKGYFHDTLTAYGQELMNTERS